MDIKAIREKYGYTQEQLSNLLDVSIGTVRSWEQNISKPGRRSQKDIDKMFKNDVKELGN